MLGEADLAFEVIEPEERALDFPVDAPEAQGEPLQWARGSSSRGGSRGIGRNPKVAELD